MKRMTLGLSALALMLAGTAMAADQHPAAGPETRAEAQARAGRWFDKMDLNHDGKLDQADRAAREGQKFDRLDTNHDGAISRDEFAAQDAHDGDHEHGDHEHGGHEHGGPDDETPDGDRHPGGRMGHWGYDHGELHGLEMVVLQRADPTHSGTVTRDGFIGATLALFDQADTNHDGILTPDEHRAAAQAMRAQFGPAQFGRGGPDGDMPPPPTN